MYEFVDGILFQEFIEKNRKETIRAVLAEILKQLVKLDELKINKEEMSRPTKHILVGKRGSSVVLIDFERAHHTLKPQNITQFCDYLVSEDVQSVLHKIGFKYKKDELINLAKRYRLEKNMNAGEIISYLLEKQRPETPEDYESCKEEE